MKVVSFKLDKISAERTGERTEGLRVNTNIDISDVKEVKSGVFKGKEQLLEIRFTYGMDYEPGFAKMEFGGFMLIGVDFKDGREILKEWADKKLPTEFRVTLLNIIIRKSSVRALQLEEDLGLPYHIKFPTLKASGSSE